MIEVFPFAGLPVADAIPVRRLDNNVDLASGRFYAHVEVLDGKGEPIPGFSAKESTRYQRVDELRLTPTWKNDARLSKLKNRVIQLRFHLKNARLYSFHIPK